MKQYIWLLILFCEHTLRIATICILLVVLNNDSFAFYEQLSRTSQALLLYGALSPFAIDIHELIIKKRAQSFVSFFQKRSLRMAKLFFFSFFPIALVGGILDAVGSQSGLEFFSNEILAPIFVTTMAAITSMAFVLIPALLIALPEQPTKKE